MSSYPQSEQLLSFAKSLAPLGIDLYCVGGCVRDWLLKRPIKDIDICSRLHPSQMIELCTQRGIVCKMRCEATGTVVLKLDGTEYEHTTFRSESYPRGGSHRPDSVRFTTTPEQDALRRDFSVNAIYLNLVTGQLKDPTGGLSDLKNKILCTTAQNPDDILKDDGIRILRLVRFAHDLGFKIDDSTFESAKANAHLLNDIPFERKRDELNKILLLDGVYNALCCIDELGIWPYVIPELEQCRGMEQRRDHHHYDVMHHLFHATENIPRDIELRYMALLHDIGKPPCKAETGKFYIHHKYSCSMSEVILKRLLMPSYSINRICFAILNHMFDIGGTAREDTIRRCFCRWGVDHTKDIIMLREADARGSGTQSDYIADRWRDILDKMIEQNVPFSVRELNIRGQDIMHELQLPPDKRIGGILTGLLYHCANKPQDNQKARLLKLAHDYNSP